MFRYALSASLSTMLAAGGAHAAAYALMEQSASGLGNAHAGLAAVAEDASTLHFNPAGLTYVDGRQVVAAGHARVSSLRFRNQAGHAEAGNAGATLWTPSLYIAADLDDKLKLGLGITTPFGQEIDYAPSWSGAPQALASRLRTVNLNPTLAWRVSPRLSLGAGLNWQQIDVRSTRGAAPAVSRLRLDDASAGWNVGALWDFDGFTRLGLAYRAGIAHHLRGTLDDVPTRMRLELPDTLSFSVWHRLNPRWELLVDLTRTGWHSIDTMQVIRVADGTTAQFSDEHWDDAWRFSVGVNYRPSREWTWRIGMAHDESPQSDAQRRTPRMPDADRIWLAMGGQYRFGPHRAMDFGYAHGYGKDARIDHVEAGTPLRGTFHSRVDLLGMQYTHGF